MGGPIPEAITVTLLNGVGATGVSATLEVGEYESGSLQTAGTFNGQVQPQISNDGTTWVNLGAVISTATITAQTFTTRYYRLNVTAYVSGAIYGIVHARS